MGIFAKIAAGLRRTKDSFINRLRRITNSFTKIDEELFEELEEAMIMSDIGVETSEEICDRLRKKIKERGITDPSAIMELIQEVIGEIMGDDTGLDLSLSPAVIMVIGVNGAGKTTTIGKLSHQFKQEGKKVLVAAADTFRAAAIDQLEVWTERAGVDIVKHAEGSDPGAVVYDALEAAKARGCDVVIIDTAGRLHNKKNLMDELAKINRIIDSKADDCSREVLLVLDATTGQNAVNQAKLFSETAPITGIVLTKLDGTAKGGIVISIKNELGIPVKLIGVGEKIDDLQPFDSRTFVEALFSDIEVEEDEELEAAEEAGEDYEAEEADYEEASEVESDTEEDDEEESEPEAEENAPDDGVANRFTDKHGFEHIILNDGSEHVYDEEGNEIIGYEEETEENDVSDEIVKEFTDNQGRRHVIYGDGSEHVYDKDGCEDLDWLSDKEKQSGAETEQHTEAETAEPEEAETTEDTETSEETADETEEKSESLIYAGGYVYDENYMAKFDEKFSYNDEVAEEDRDTENEAEDTEEADEEPETEEITPAEPEKKKKRGFFSRLFGRKKNDEEEEEEDTSSDDDTEEESDED